MYKGLCKEIPDKWANSRLGESVSDLYKTKKKDLVIVTVYEIKRYIYHADTS